MEITDPAYTPSLAGAMGGSYLAQSGSDFAAYLTEQTPEALLSSITEDGVRGLMKWKIEEMKRKITQEVMTSKNLTADDLEAMEPQERAAIEKLIMQEVQEQLKRAINEQMKREKKIEIGFASTRLSDQSWQALFQVQAADSRRLQQAGMGESAADGSADARLGTDGDFAAM